MTTLFDYEARKALGETGHDDQDRECPICYEVKGGVGRRRFRKGEIVSCYACWRELARDYLDSRR